MVVWKELEGIQLDLSDIKDEAIINMVKNMSQDEKLKIIEAIKKEAKENRDLARSMQLAIRIATIAVTTLL